jgi:hypothetical protein
MSPKNVQDSKSNQKYANKYKIIIAIKPSKTEKVPHQKQLAFHKNRNKVYIFLVFIGPTISARERKKNTKIELK